MKKYMRIVSFASIIAVLTACGGSVKLADGSYEGTSSVYTNPDGSASRPMSLMALRRVLTTVRSREA